MYTEHNTMTPHGAVVLIILLPRLMVVYTRGSVRGETLGEDGRSLRETEDTDRPTKGQTDGAIDGTKSVTIRKKGILLFEEVKCCTGNYFEIWNMHSW